MRWRLVKKLLLQDAGSVKFLLSLQKFGAARRCRTESFKCGQRTGREGIDIYKSVFYAKIQAILAFFYSD